ncbi:MAG: hypothetical protein PUP90_04670 [Nostoc sp. S4]|nr:hypothetical protein [Nostoc sp. S4]
MLDVYDESVIIKVANDLGLNGDRIVELVYGDVANQAPVAALAEYKQFGYLGVLTWWWKAKDFRVRIVSIDWLKS